MLGWRRADMEREEESGSSVGGFSEIRSTPRFSSSQVPPARNQSKSRRNSSQNSDDILLVYRAFRSLSSKAQSRPQASASRAQHSKHRTSGSDIQQARRRTVVVVR